MNKRTQLATGLTVTIGLFLTACGGSGEGSAVTDSVADDDVVETVSSPTEPPATDPPTTDPPVTDAPATDPPVTDPPVTDPPVTDLPVTDPPESDLPEWASGATVTVDTDTGPLELPVELVPFCESSRSFHSAANGINLLDDEQVGTLQQLFAALLVLAPMTIETAPSEEFAEEPAAARDQLTVIISAFDEVGYDSNRLSEVSDPQSLFDAIEGFQETVGSLRSFLVEVCGADGAVLDEQSRSAVAVAAEAAGEVIEPDAPVESVPGSPIANDASTIMLQVPTGWTETEESFRSDYQQFSASADIEAFNALEAPGVLVLRGEGGFRDGGFVGRVLSFQFELEEAGCVLVDEQGYDDGVYNGQERVFECGTEGLDVRLLGGTEADESLYALVLLVHPSDGLGVRDLIVATFEVA